jgi:hypothetical protein
MFTVYKTLHNSEILFIYLKRAKLSLFLIKYYAIKMCGGMEV